MESLLPTSSSCVDEERQAGAIELYTVEDVVSNDRT